MGFALPGDHYLTDEQVCLLLKPIHPARVQNLRGLSHVEGYDVRAELNRVFGFCRWSEETLDQQLIFETEKATSAGKPAFYVAYRTRVRLTVYTPDGTPLAFYDGAHVGESTNPSRGDAHGNALTNSQTYALKRAAHNLGDQFGLSLYNKGSQEALVRWTLVRPEPGKTTTTVNTDDVPAVSPENPEAAEETPVQPKSTQRRAAKEKPLRTAQELADEAAGADLPDVITAIGKRAGELGKLSEEITVKGTEETLELRKYLYRRIDELNATKSAGSSEADPGTGGSDQG